MKTRSFITFFGVIVSLMPVFARAENILTFSRALALTKENNPQLKAYNLQINAATSGIEQASLLPNPQFGFELENFGGDFSGTRQLETTISITQPVVIGGRIASGVEVAKAQKELAQRNADYQLNNTLSQMAIAYADLQKEQALLEISIQDRDFAREVLSAAQKKLKHGGVLEAEVTRAEVNWHNKELLVEQVRASIEVSKLKLLSFWGGKASEFILEPQEVNPLKISFDSTGIQTFPVLRAERSKVETNKRKVALARSLAIPDLNTQIGVRRLEEADDTTFVASLSIPLPVFNRNQGAIAQSKSLRTASEESLRNVEFQVNARLSGLRERRKILLPQYNKLKNAILNDSKKALHQIKEAYALGRVGYIDLADTQRSYFDVKRQLIATVFSLNQLDFEYASLAGLFSHAPGESKDE